MTEAGATNGGVAVHAFIVELDNRPGSLAELCEALGERDINISGVSGAAWDDDGAVGLITTDDAGTRSVLDARDVDYRECDLVAASMEDRPGSLGRAARRLADANVNVVAIIPTGMSGSRVTVAFAVDDAGRAREALGDMASVATSSI